MFSRTHRALAAETEGRAVGLLALLGALIACWLAWFFLVRVNVHEASSEARVEVSRAVQPLDAAVSGRVVAMPGLELGRTVLAGDVIIEFDDEPQRLALAQSIAHLEAISLEVRALTEARQVQVEAADAARREGNFAVSEAVSKRRLARIRAEWGKREAARVAGLFANGAVSEMESQRTSAESRSLLASTAAANAETGRARSLAQRSVLEHRARIAELDRVLAVRSGEALVERAKAQQLEHELEQRRIRAGTGGRVSEIAKLHVGSFVPVGTRVATLVASDELRVVADFAPAAALGRLREGQLAQVQLDGFPWLEYGHLTARVRRVATELRDSKVRVELEVIGRSQTLTLQHGMPATVSVEVEQATGAQLVWRAVGARLQPRAAIEVAP